MNDTKDTHRGAFKSHLLATVSAIVVLGMNLGANANESEHPSVWIELGWQSERLAGAQDVYPLPFDNLIVDAGLPSPLNLEKTRAWSHGVNGQISFEPENSGWVFSVGVRYARMQRHRSVHDQTNPPPQKQYLGSALLGTGTPTVARFVQTKIADSESHTILDFAVGRDVGIGLFGAHANATLSAGVRYAQIGLASHSEVDSRPMYHHFTNLRDGLYYRQDDSAVDSASRSFHGLGPTLSWKASSRLAGSSQTSELEVDWGANVGVLFGRQTADVHHQSSQTYRCRRIFPNQCPRPIYVHTTQVTADSNRSRSVVTPNVGGFAGVSLNWTNAKISMGYRADAYFNAIDGGAASRQTYARILHGPYATFSVGLP